MLDGYKTYIIGIISILAGAAALFTNKIDFAQYSQIVETALLGMGIRNGIANQ